jgi:hypothetical protein
MAEFNDRMVAQRSILQIVNQTHRDREELFGLSKHAIDRWIRVNQIDDNCRLVQLIRQSAEKLFFLANKSQETVSPVYASTANELSELAKSIKCEATSHSSTN